MLHAFSRYFPVALLTLAVAGRTVAADDDFKPLFDGTSFAGWKMFFDPNADKPDATKTWTIKEGAIECHGSPNAYFYTEKSYSNYVIKYDWKFPAEQPPKTTMNTGLLVHIQE